MGCRPTRTHRLGGALEPMRPNHGRTAQADEAPWQEAHAPVHRPCGLHLWCPDVSARQLAEIRLPEMPEQNPPGRTRRSLLRIRQIALPVTGAHLVGPRLGK